MAARRHLDEWPAGSREGLKVAFQELLFLSALQLLLGPRGEGPGAIEPCLSLVLTRAARDGNKTYVH